MRIRSAGHAMFAVTLIAVGILGFIARDFTVVWAPVPQAMPARSALIYLCAVISTACGIGLLVRRAAPLAARLLFGFALVWLLVFRVPPLFHSVAVDVYWALCKALVMVSAAWVLDEWFVATRNGGLRIARAMFGIAMIGFGIAHFQYIQNTASLVPAWLPAHVAWAYLTGVAFVAAGIAMLADVYGHVAAMLSAWQMGLFLLLVWIPRLATGTVSEFQRSEAIISWVLTAAAWLVADSYR